MKTPLNVAIMGPTASGKSQLAEALASRWDCRIINADAFQVYRGFDIGTAKPSDRTRYDLIDILEPDEWFSAGEFVKRAAALCRTYASQDLPSIVCGGTGLYVRALFESYSEMSKVDEAVRNELRESELDTAGIETDSETARNPVRLRRAIEKRHEVKSPPEQLPARRVKVGLEVPRDLLHEKIQRRVLTMVHNGFLEEVESLLSSGVSVEAPAMRAIGYAEMAACAEGRTSLDSAIEGIIVRTRQYAKRQITWLRREPNLRWIDATASIPELLEHTLDLIEREPNGEID